VKTEIKMITLDVFPNLGNDVSRSISKRIGRGSFGAGLGFTIDLYNKEHPDNKIDYSDSGLETLFTTIEEYPDEEKWDNSKKVWDEWILKPDNAPIKKIFDEMQIEVDAYNKLMDRKYNSLEKFYRGTSIDEIREYLDGEEIGSFSNDDFDFISLTMLPSQARQTFNQGVVVEYDAGFIRDSGDAVKMTYTMNPTKILAIEHESSVSDLETQTSKNNALFVDEQEIRVDKYLQIKPSSIKRIIFFPEKIGYVSLVDETENDELIDSIENRDGTERVWMLENNKQVTDELLSKYGRITNEVHIDFQHRFPSSMF